jgi:hypothetical protein
VVNGTGAGRETGGEDAAMRVEGRRERIGEWGGKRDKKEYDKWAPQRVVSMEYKI